MPAELTFQTGLSAGRAAQSLPLAPWARDRPRDLPLICHGFSTPNRHAQEMVSDRNRHVSAAPRLPNTPPSGSHSTAELRGNETNRAQAAAAPALCRQRPQTERLGGEGRGAGGWSGAVERSAADSGARRIAERGGQREGENGKERIAGRVMQGGGTGHPASEDVRRADSWTAASRHLNHEPGARTDPAAEPPTQPTQHLACPRPLGGHLLDELRVRAPGWTGYRRRGTGETRVALKKREERVRKQERRNQKKWSGGRGATTM